MLRRCSRSVLAGLERIRGFDQVLVAGDLDSAASRLVDLWSKLYEPAQILTGWADGEFWRDWHGRVAFEDNLRTVYQLLNDPDEFDTIESLEEVRNCLVANFSLLSEAITWIGAAGRVFDRRRCSRNL